MAAVDRQGPRSCFTATAANCVKCHGPSALGDGQTNDYDDWSKPLDRNARRALQTEQESLNSDSSMSPEERTRSSEAQLAFDSQVLKSDALPPRHAIPRNLRQGIYRGGRRPLDIYRRISAGINGVPMPGVGPATAGRDRHADAGRDLEPGRLRSVAAVSSRSAKPPRQQHPIE